MVIRIFLSPLDFISHFIHHTIGTTDLPNLSPAPHFKSFLGTRDLHSEMSMFQQNKKLCSKCSTLLVTSLNLSSICWFIHGGRSPTKFNHHKYLWWWYSRPLSSYKPQRSNSKPANPPRQHWKMDP